MIIEPYNYQKHILNSTDKFLIVNKSRQIGISLILALLGLMSSVFEGKNVLIISQSQRLANKVMGYVDSMMDDVLASNPYVKLKKNTTEEKKFYNSYTKVNSEILSVPAKGASARGNSSAVLIMDEVAFWDNDKELYTAVLPSITAQPDYRVILASSPNGEGNLFHSIFTDPIRYPLYKRLTITIDDAISDGLKTDFENFKQSLDEDSIRQEFYCEFITNNLAYISNELIKKCLLEFDVNKIQEQEGEIWGGLDIGSTSDLTALSFCKKIKNKYYLLETIEIKNKLFSEQREIIESAIALYNPVKVIGDARGLGTQIMQELSLNDSRIEGIQWTNDSKNIAFTNLKKEMEKGNLLFEPNIELQRQFNSIKKKVSTSNNIIFEIPRNKNGHGDSAMSIIYSLYAGRENSGKFHIGFL